jgi:hypothetical protein
LARDLRSYAKQTNIRLFVGGILLLFLVGDGLIYLFFGINSAIMGLICLALGLAPLFLIWLILAVIEWVTKKVDEE